MTTSTDYEVRRLDLAEQRRRAMCDRAPLIAAALGYGWQVRPSRYGHADRFELHGPDGEHIMITAGPHRVEARGLHPKVGRYFPTDFGVTPRTISFDAAKTTAQMAADIRRRLLPNVREVGQVVTAKQAARDLRLLLRRTFLEDAAELLPLEWKRAADYRGEPEHTDAHMSAFGVHLAVDMPEYSAEDVKLTISGLRRDEALMIARTLAQIHQARRP